MLSFHKQNDVINPDKVMMHTDSSIKKHNFVMRMTEDCNYIAHTLVPTKQYVGKFWKALLLPYFLGLGVPIFHTFLSIFPPFFVHFFIIYAFVFVFQYS